MTTTRVYTLAGAFGLPEQIPAMLGGTITNGNQVIPVNYPNWTIFEQQVEMGARILNDQLKSDYDGVNPQVVMGHSLGSVVACNWIVNYGLASGDNGWTGNTSLLSFVLLGNSVRPYGGLCYDIGWYQPSRLPADGDCNGLKVRDLARQYDGWADWPSNWLVYEALANAFEGLNIVHPDYKGVRLDDPTNVSYVVGDITYMWAITAPAPILGTTNSDLVADWDAQVRATIETGYSRPVPIPYPSGESAP